MVHRRAGWLVGAVVAAVLGVVGLAVVTVFLTGKGLGGAADWSAVLSLLLAGLLAVLSLVVWMIRRAGPGHDGRGGSSTALLRRAVRVQWSVEAGARQLMQPRPLRLTWRPTPLPVAVSVRPGGAGRRSGSLRGSLADDGSDARASARELVAAFAAGGRRQLVVLGAPGAGKTTLAVLYTIAAVDAARDEDPVPVLLSVAGWNPAEPIEDWLSRRVAQDYPDAVGPGRAGRRAARRLVDDLMILPVLDGLDELPGPLLGPAVEDLERVAGAGLPMIVTCRHREFEQAVERAGALSNAAVIDIEPVRPADAAAYLTDREIQGSTRWRPVLNQVRQNPTGAIASVLSTPLMLAVARRVYQRPGADPGDLTGFDTAEDLERHLLGEFVTTNFPDPGAIGREQRWLAFLARHLRDTVRDPNLYWWRLARAVPAGVVTGLIAVVLTLCGVLLGWSIGVGTWTILSATVGLFVGVLCGRRTTRAVRGPDRSAAAHPLWRAARQTAGDLAVALATALAAGSVATTVLLFAWDWFDGDRAVAAATGLVMWFDDIGTNPGTVALLAAVAAALAAAGIGFGAGRAGEPRRTTVRARRLLPSLGIVLAAGAVVPVIFRVSTLSAPWAFSLPFLVALPVALGRGLIGPPIVATAVSPRSVLRSDRSTLLVTVAVMAAGAAAITIAVAWFLLSVTDATMLGLALAVSLSIAAVAVCGSGAPWVPYTLARLWLAARGHLPWRPMRFLRRAHATGVLRQAGAAYQFRHDRLRTYLADHGHTPARGRRTVTGRRWPRWLGPPIAAVAVTLLPLTVLILPKAYSADLRGHDAAVFDLRYGTNGTLVSAANDGTLRIWDPVRHRLRHAVDVTGTDMEFGMAVSPDGSTVAADTTRWDITSDPTGVVGLWDTTTAQRRTIEVPDLQYLNSLAFSPDGTVLAVGGYDEVRLVDVRTGRHLGTVAAAGVDELAFDPGGSMLATIGRDGLRLWDATAHTLVRTLSDARFGRLAFGRDGSTLVTIENGYPITVLQLWDLDTGAVRWSVGGIYPVPTSVAVDADGSTLITGESDGRIRVRDGATGQVRSTRNVDLSSVDAVARDPHGNWIATGSTSGSVRLWKV